MSVSLSSLYGAGAQLFDDKGVILNGGYIYVYQAGTTTLAVTWSDSAGTVPNPNPIQLNSAGRTPNEIYLTNGVGYKFIVMNSVGASVGPTWDNIYSIGSSSGGGTTTSPWTETGLVPTYASATSFTVPGNQTSVFPAGARIKSTVTGGTAYSTVTSSTFTSSTLVTVVNDSLALDSGLNDVAVGYLPQALYSSGTFTPTLTFGGSAPGGTYTRQVGKYVQVNNMVMFSIDIIFVRSSGSGNVSITGLPFSPVSSYQQYVAVGWPGAFGGSGPVNYVSTFGVIQSGQIAIYYNSTGATNTHLDGTFFTNGSPTASEIVVTGVYTLS